MKYNEKYKPKCIQIQNYNIIYYHFFILNIMNSLQSIEWNMASIQVQKVDFFKFQIWDF